jgi:ABC-type Co2+ transport system permease subunit
MAAIHAVIGLGEALVTVAAIAFVKKLKPEIVHG